VRRVKWVVHTSQYWSPFIERDEDDATNNGGGEEGEDGEGGDTSDRYFAGGNRFSEESGNIGHRRKNCVVHVPTQLNAQHRDVRYRIEARVTDAGKREIAGNQRSPSRHTEVFKWGSPRTATFIKKMKTINATAVARDYDGHPVQTAVHAELVRWHWYGYGNTARSREDVIESQDVRTQDDGDRAR